MINKASSMTLGGYKAVDADDLNEPELLKAAKFAVMEYVSQLPSSSRIDRSRVVVPVDGDADDSEIKFEVLQAATQVVAGVNFKMDIAVLDPFERNCLEVFSVVVYDHFGDLSLTRFEGEPMQCE